MKNRPLNIFIIAGEASGDLIGGRVMAALKKLSANEIRFFGIGGETMRQQGLSSIIQMSDISLMGFAEIVPAIPRLLMAIDKTVRKIRVLRPDILITIDSPGFNYRVAKKLKNFGVKKLHIVAPTVWAYKPKRAKKAAELFHRLLVLLPFEPPYFTREGLATDYIGHPVIEGKPYAGSRERFYQKSGLEKDAPLVLMMPGSRRGEIERLLPVFEETIKLLADRIGNLNLAILATPQFSGMLAEKAKQFPVKTIVISDADDKADARAAANIALVKSGTGTLELALAGIPMVVAYKVNQFSSWMIRRMIRIRYASLINIILNREAIPEFLQENCQPELIALEMEKIMTDPVKRGAQLTQIADALDSLGLNDTAAPSEKAAEIILREI